MRTLEEINKDLFELNRVIMDLRTELYIMEGRRRDLFDERSAMVMELQYELDKKEKENKK